MLRRLVKFTIAVVLYYTGLIRLFGKNAPVILMYHRVLEDRDRKKADTQPGMCVTKSTFEKQMQFLKGKYHLIKLNELVAFYKEGKTPPASSAVITFDDGWWDNYSLAFPIMQKHRTPGTIFLCTDLIVSDKLPIFIEVSLLLGETDIWPDKAVAAFKKVVDENRLLETNGKLSEVHLADLGRDAFNWMVTLMLLEYEHIEKIAEELKKLGNIDKNDWNNRRWIMNWDEIREMDKDVIDFGSHGESHDLMINISLEQVKKELIDSKKIIEEKLGHEIEIFSYPNGDYNSEVKKLVVESGYRGAVAVSKICDNSPQPDPFALLRLNISEGTTMGPGGNFSKAIFACRLARIF